VIDFAGVLTQLGFLHNTAVTPAHRALVCASHKICRGPCHVPDRLAVIVVGAILLSCGWPE